MKKWDTLIFTFLIILGSCTGPRDATDHVSPGTEWESCLHLYSDGSLKEAEDCLNKIPDQNRGYMYYDLKGTIESEKGNYSAAAKSLSASIRLDSNTENTFAHFKLGKVLWKAHKYAEAGEAFKKFSGLVENPRPSLKTQISYFIRSAPVARDLYMKPKPYTPLKVKDSVNTQFDELGITQTVDRSYRIITRRDHQEDLFESRGRKDSWDPPTPLTSINTPYNDGAAALSGDGQTLVFTGCNYPRTQPGRQGSCDIFITRKNGEGWNPPSPINSINSVYWDSQPTLSVDGKAIIFSSEREGGYGKRDLWISVQSNSGEWTEPINLGPNINTPGNEENPFLHADERTLYFTSDYLPGFGGRDLFYSHRLQGNHWTTAKNLGYPINSSENEEGIFVDAAGTIGYFSSAKDGNFDLYSFEMDVSNRPATLIDYEWILLDPETNSEIQNAQIQIVDLYSGTPLRRTFTNEKGMVRFLITSDSSYSLNIEKEGYHFLSKNVKVPLTSRYKARDTIYLQRIDKSKEPVILENIFFATGSTELEPASDHELLNLSRYLSENPEIRIHIMGHTDNIGAPMDNLKLSEGRANVVRNFLITQGIARERIRATGYGESRPIADNDTPSGRAKNRRTEFIIE